MNPSGQVKVKTNAVLKSRLRLFGHGEHPDIANEGDLLLVSENGEIEFQLLVRGKDMFMLSHKVEQALKLYEENKDWLSKPATIYRMPEPAVNDRLQANLNAINNFYKHKQAT